MRATTMAALPKITAATGISNKRPRAARSTSRPTAVTGKQVAVCPAGWLRVLELAYPGGVLLLELVLQVIQQVTVMVIQR